MSDYNGPPWHDNPGFIIWLSLVFVLGLLTVNNWIGDWVNVQGKRYACEETIDE